MPNLISTFCAISRSSSQIEPSAVLYGLRACLPTEAAAI